jgi:hypothetical protein
MKEVFDRDLGERVHLSHKQVDEAVRSLKNEGAKISKLRLRRELGVAESREIDRAVPHRRTALTDELLRLMAAFDAAITTSSHSRDQRSTLTRDYLIFLSSVQFNQRIEVIVAWSVEDGRTMLQSAQAKADNRGQFAEAFRTRTSALMLEYLSSIRPKFAAGSSANKSLFLSRFGLRLEGHSVRARVSQLMGCEFDSALWRSADAFLNAIDDVNGSAKSLHLPTAASGRS